MDFMTWAIVGAAAAILIPLACYFLPANTTIVIDTPTSTARAEMRLFWGLGPAIIARALPKRDNGTPLARFDDAARIGHALMTPSIADAAYAAIKDLYDLKPRVVRLQLGVNLGDNAQNVVVQTAVQAALAAAPASLRERAAIAKREAPGAELSAQFELDASPARLSAIYARFRGSRAVQEFRRRLNRKQKPGKKGAREVRVS
ncbi:MAG: hypothetical protein ACT4OF_01085 [Caulobacteraceae bacterium]